MTIEIAEDVALRLEALAKAKDADISDLLRDMLASNETELDTDEKRWATLADLARHAKELNMASPEPVNSAERSREILNSEFADYLQSRIDS